MGKATKTELLKRVEEVLRIRLDGAQFHDILQYASEKQWGVTERQLWTYVRKADALLIERQEKKRKPLVALGVARREALYARALDAADYRAALAVLTDLDRLQGLYKTERELKDQLSAQRERIRELETKRAGVDREELIRIAREGVREALAMEPPTPDLPPPPEEGPVQ